MELTNNLAEVREALTAAKAEALERLGQAWAQAARSRAGVFEQWGEELRESVVHQVEGDAVAVGSGLDIAAYAELGTGPHYTPPPEWMENRVPKGTKVPPGADHWIYFDEKDGAFKVGSYRAPTPFIRPALEENREIYRGIVEETLRG